MSISLKQFLELPKGAILSMSKQSFAVTGFMDEMELREPVLVSQQSGERLHGAIYVTHLLRIESLPGEVDLPVEPPVIKVDQVADPFIDLSLEIGDLGEPFDDFYCSELATGRMQHASHEQYLNDMHAVLEGGEIRA